MDIEFYNTRQPKEILRAVWLIVFLAVAFGYHFIKGAVAFILTALYELFIQQSQAS